MMATNKEMKKSGARKPSAKYRVPGRNHLLPIDNRVRTPNVEDEVRVITCYGRQRLKLSQHAEL